jgi:hypothetical protein
MNTKDFLRLGVPWGEATRRATDFVDKFILVGDDKFAVGKGDCGHCREPIGISGE